MAYSSSIMNTHPPSSMELQAHAGAAPLLLKPKAAAHAVQISTRKLAELTSSGDIRAVRIGRSVRYDPADLAAFIEKHKTGGAA